MYGSYRDRNDQNLNREKSNIEILDVKNRHPGVVGANKWLNGLCCC